MDCRPDLFALPQFQFLGGQSAADLHPHGRVAAVALGIVSLDRTHLALRLELDDSPRPAFADGLLGAHHAGLRLGDVKDSRAAHGSAVAGSYGRCDRAYGRAVGGVASASLKNRRNIAPLS